AMGKLLERGLKERLANHPNVGDIRGKGLFWGIELVEDKATKRPFNPKKLIAMRIHEHGMEEPFNISLYPANGVADGVNGDAIMISPPYIVTKEEVERIVDLTDKVIRDFFAKKQ
ncbi:MAG: aminotransferase class III-fold pyridoxal phosphate-dependent enzyme, partial [Terriglobus roseus]|nr:aminotransferase class III-fold pyridoxal phosphate-dependent enzyme [Terriglobus roseus]